MKKHLIPAGFAVTMAACLLCACAGSAPADADLPKIAIGYTSYQPFIDRDEAQNVHGIDAELAQEACRRMNYKPFFVHIDAADRDALLGSHQIDCYWSGFAIEGHADDYQWTKPYLRSRQVAIVLKDSPLQELSDLEGKRIAVQASGPSEAMLMHTPTLPQVEMLYSLPDLEQVQAALQYGYCDAVCGKEISWQVLLQNDMEDYRILEPELGYADLGVAFAPDADPDLVQLLDDALQDMAQDGTIAAVIENYGLAQNGALEEVKPQ